MGLHPHRRDRRGLGRAAGPGRGGLRRRPGRPGARGRRRRRRARARSGPGGLGPGPRRQSDRDVSHRQARPGADVAATVGGRSAGRSGDDRQRRGVGGNGRGKCLQRVEGRCGPAHQEHGHRLRRTRHQGQRRVPRVHRHPDAGGHLQGARHGGHPGRCRRAPQAAPVGSPRGDRRRRRLPALRRCLGYTAGRDHGITAKLGLSGPE